MFTIATPSPQPVPTAHEILEAYECAKSRCYCHRAAQRGHGNTHCPAHADADPSLTVREHDGKVLFDCKAGCEQDAVLAALRRDRLWPDPSLNGAVNGNGAGRARSRWAYEWQAGEPVAYHKRIERGDGRKSFVWELPNGRLSDGDIAASNLPLYRRTEVLTANPELVIAVCEGEKAADAMAAHGFVATSFAGGASQTDFGKALDDLRGRHVALFPDNDEPGFLLMARLDAALRGIAASVRVIEIPDLPEKGDAYDYFAAGRAAAEIERLIEATAAAGTQARTRRYEIIDAPDFLNRPPFGWLVPGFLPDQSFAVIVGGPGSLKTFIALDLAASVSLGVPFQGFPTRQGSVLYVLGEGAGGFPLRMQAWQQYRKTALPRALKLLTFPVPLVDRQAVSDLIADVQSFGEKFEIVFIDTLSRSLAGEDENASLPMTKAVQSAGLLQQALGCCVVLIHHGRKSDGELRGHGSLRGALDTIIFTDRDRSRDVVRVECWKQKDGQEFAPFFLRPIAIDLGPAASIHDVTTERVSSLVIDRLSADEEEARRGERRLAGLNDAQISTLRVLGALGAQGATEGEWRDACRKTFDPELSRQTHSKRIKTLMDRGIVSIVTARQGDGVYLADSRFLSLVDAQGVNHDS